MNDKIFKLKSELKEICIFMGFFLANLLLFIFVSNTISSLLEIVLLILSIVLTSIISTFLILICKRKFKEHVFDKSYDLGVYLFSFALLIILVSYVFSSNNQEGTLLFSLFLLLEILLVPLIINVFFIKQGGKFYENL